MRFIKMALKQLPYFQHLKDTDTIFYDIIFKLVTYEKNQGDVLIKKGELIDYIYIVERAWFTSYMGTWGRWVMLRRLIRRVRRMRVRRG